MSIFLINNDNIIYGGRNNTITIESPNNSYRLGNNVKISNNGTHEDPIIIQNTTHGLTFTSHGTSTIQYSTNNNAMKFEYLLESSNNRTNWRYFAPNSTITLQDNESLKLRTITNNNTILYGSKFKFTGNIKISGNIMSLIDQTCQMTAVPDNCFQELFAVCDSEWNSEEGAYYQVATVDISDLQLPATTLGSHAYHGMFWGCQSITKAPELPATTIGSFAYKSMFDQCSSLEFPPSVLPAETLTEGCYFQMFQGCTKLKTIPDIEAIELGASCCGLMFKDCSSLGDLSHFELRATTPPTDDPSRMVSCYQAMFYNSSLTHTPYIHISNVIHDKSINGTIYLMFAECMSLKFVYLPNCTIDEILKSDTLLGTSKVNNVLIECKDGIAAV